MPFLWWKQYPSAHWGQFCHWEKELWVPWGLECFSEVCFSVLSVVTSALSTLWCIEGGNTQNTQGWGCCCRDRTQGLRAALHGLVGADEWPCPRDVSNAMKSRRGFALSGVPGAAGGCGTALVVPEEQSVSAVVQLRGFYCQQLVRAQGISGCITGLLCSAFECKATLLCFLQNFSWVSRWSFPVWGKLNCISYHSHGVAQNNLR